MKDDHGSKPSLLFSSSPTTRRRLYSALAILAAIAYTFGIITSPFLSFLACKDAIGEPIQRPSTEQNPQHLTANPAAISASADLTRFQLNCAEPVASKLVRQTIIENLFNGTSPFEGFPPEHAKPLLRRKRIKGWGSTGSVFEKLVREVNPRIILELGTFLGASAIHMGLLARDLRLKTQILCVDDFRGWPGFRDRFRDIHLVNGDVTLLYQFMQNIEYMNLTESLLPLPFSTASMLRKLCEWGVYADLIEVDAAHDFQSAWADINAAHAILRPGGVMFGHDYHTKMDNRGVRRAVNLFAKLKNFRVEPDGEHWILRSH